MLLQVITFLLKKLLKNRPPQPNLADSPKNLADKYSRALETCKWKIVECTSEKVAFDSKI